MDLTTTATTTSPNTITATSTPDTENETPPGAIQPNKSLFFTNGFVVKKNSPHHHRHPPQPLAAVVIYKECLKNHAASLGGHAVDGCGEFMASPTANPTYPTSLKCAACGCHRNFHRRDDDPTTTTHFIDFHLQPPPPLRSSPLSSPSPPPLQPSYYSSAPHMLLALSTAVAEDHPTMNNHPVVTPATPTAAKAENPNGRKRFRTRFSQEQKEKMFSFSEKLGWKMQKCDERLVEEFCNEAGVGKGVLKVWMHNNKHTLGKRNITAAAIYHHSNSNGKVLNFDGNSSPTTTNNNSHHHNESNNGVHLHVSTNGSPPSA